MESTLPLPRTEDSAADTDLSDTDEGGTGPGTHSTNKTEITAIHRAEQSPHHQTIPGQTRGLSDDYLLPQLSTQREQNENCKRDVCDVYDDQISLTLSTSDATSVRFDSL